MHPPVCSWTHREQDLIRWEGIVNGKTDELNTYSSFNTQYFCQLTALHFTMSTDRMLLNCVELRWIIWNLAILEKICQTTGLGASAAKCHETPQKKYKINRCTTWETVWNLLTSDWCHWMWALSWGCRLRDRVPPTIGDVVLDRPLKISETDHKPFQRWLNVLHLCGRCSSLMSVFPYLSGPVSSLGLSALIFLYRSWYRQVGGCPWVVWKGYPYLTWQPQICFSFLLVPTLRSEIPPSLSINFMV